MAGDASGIKAGRAYVEIGANAGPLDSALRSTQQRLLSFASSMRQVSMMVLGLGTLVASGFGYAIKQASDAEETWASFRSVFKGLTEEAASFASSTAEAVGRSPAEVRKAMMQFQALGVALGYSEKQAYGLSKSMVQAGLDLAAFWNIDEADAYQRIRSSLSGSVEAMDQYGINLHAAAVEQQLLLMGINKSAAQATEQEKVMARVAIIQRSLLQQGATGQAVRELGSFANQWRRLKAQFVEVATSIGKAILPAITNLTTTLGDAFRALKKFIDANPQLVVVAGQVVLGIVGMSAAFLTLSYLLPVLGTGLALVMGLLAALATPVGAAAAAVIGLVTAFLTLTDSGRTAVSSFMQDIGALFDHFKQVWGGILLAIKGGDLGLAMKIGSAALQLAWMQGVEVISDIWSTAMINVEGAWDYCSTALARGFLGINEDWVRTTTDIEAAFDRLGLSLSSIWATVFQSLMGAIDIFGIEAIRTFNEVMFKFREAKIAITPMFGKAGAYANIQSDREKSNTALDKSAADAAAKRQAKIDAAGDPTEFNKRQKARDDRVALAADAQVSLKEDADRRAKDRQTRLDRVGEVDPAVAAKQAELDALLQESADLEETNKRRLGYFKGAKDKTEADLRPGLGSTDTKKPSANALGTAGAAATIARSISRVDPHLEEAKKQTKELKNAVDSLKKINKKPPTEVTILA